MDPAPTKSNADYSHDSGSLADAEREFRCRWHEAHRDRFVADQEEYQESKEKWDGFAASAEEGLELLADLRRTVDLRAFVERTDSWSRKPTTLAFRGVNGQMLLNQLVKRASDPEELAALLAESLTVPASDDEAAAKIRELCAYVESIKVGTHPAPGRVPYLLSYFWALADHDRWPVIWTSSEEYVEFLTGEARLRDQAARYLSFVSRVREVASDNNEFEMTAEWWKTSRPVFLDEVLADRAEFGLNKSQSALKERERNAVALVGIARSWGRTLVEDVSDALGHEMEFHVPPRDWMRGHPRGDLWVDWRIPGTPGLGFRVWVNHLGAAVALRPTVQRSGWRAAVTPIIQGADYADCRMLGGEKSHVDEDVGFFGNSGEFVYGRWFDRDEFAEVDLPAIVVEVATQLRPLFEELLTLALGEDTNSGDPLSPFVNEWLLDSKYPTEDDDYHQSKREDFAALLARVPIPISDLSRIWNTGDYGGPGPMSKLNESLADPETVDHTAKAFHYLCWGDDPVEARINRVLTDPEFQVTGLGESVILKLLAITHPDTYLPIFPYRGDKGKQALLRLLNIDEPEGTPGEVQVASNKLLRDRLEPFFGDDLWGMSRFLWWYLEREDSGASDGPDAIEELSGKLLVERSFLDEIIALLEKKWQVIFYGPPGTGKTYLARELAKTLVPDPDRRAIVQFHPASSYEDFFEGYRPYQPEDSTGEDLSYRLTPGPLARIAAKARDAPGEKHVMIIDEINRANLPKVLGELLYLLEYRDESIQTLYRPGSGFELPENLWFIGTMNTADRSIALVDAALRRRFQFVQFFPDEAPMAGLLDRWLETNGEPTWVGELVGKVNDELEDDLRGSHLLLGPSYFMERDLDEVVVRRIWKYNIEPLLEDQFFGDRELIAKYRFENVYERYRAHSRADEDTEQGDAPTEATGSVADEGEDAEG